MPCPAIPPAAKLVCLAVISLIVQRLFLQFRGPRIGSGAIVMATGIFALDALQQIPVGGRDAVTTLVAIELLVIWAWIAASYVEQAREPTRGKQLADPITRFAVGTWPAATAMVAETTLLGVAGWRPVVWALGLLALMLWAWYLALVLRVLPSLIHPEVRQRVDGTILLPTVATQAVVIWGVVLLPQRTPHWHWLLAAMVGGGAAFYVIGTAVIAVRYLRHRGWRLADDWPNTNCILHGAVSITGLAALTSKALPIGWLPAIWLWAAGMFVVVESAEITRAGLRLREYGLRQGLMAYDVSQWARNFTFGMFYAFTLHLHQNLPAAQGIGWLAGLWRRIAMGGQYVVLALLLAELALLFSHALGAGPARHPLRAPGFGRCKDRRLPRDHLTQFAPHDVHPLR